MAVIALVCFLAMMILPKLADGGRAKIPMIVSNLKQIDLAKQVWASDHKITGAVQITEQDLSPYFSKDRGSNGLVIPVDGEQYAVNPFGSPPEAQLTRDMGKLPKGTVIRLGSNGVERIPPNLAAPRTGAYRSAAETNGQSSATGSRR
ncbi:MAG: hypothetical protein ABSG78_20870 [Verrucomicrobiota bacterium]